LSVLSLVKYHGLGNDFLVALDGPGLDAAARERREHERLPARGSGAGSLEVRSRADPVGELARVLCDRHTGVGADGLIVLRASVDGGDVRMELRNADGGRAETSGNGLRCLAVAVLEAGLVPGPEFAIETDAGLRRAVVRHRDEHGAAEVSVEMGRLRVVPSSPVTDVRLPGSTTQPWPSWKVDAGNPHMVLLAPSLDGIEIASIGPELERMRPDGQNVEIAARAGEPDGDAESAESAESAELSLLVWERGAGATLACGSGSAAAAAALHAAGISAAHVRVHNPGGTAEVTLSGDDPLAPLAELAGPVQRVAGIEVDPAGLGVPQVAVVAS